MMKPKLKKVLMMALCIGGPIAAMSLLALSRFGVIEVSPFWATALFLLCPLSHLLIIPFMGKMMGKESGQSCH